MATSNPASIYEAQSDPIPVVNALGNVFEETQIATAGQTVFNLVSFNYTPGTFTLQVYVNGIRRRVGANYTETSSSRVTLLTPSVLNDAVTFRAEATSGLTTPNGGGVPVGGTAGQVLSKINSSDYNTQWVTNSFSNLYDGVLQSVVAANTIDLTTVDDTTRSITITGNSTIAGFIGPAGLQFTARFTGTPTMAHSAALVCPNAANIPVSAGSSCMFRFTADNTVEVILFSSAASAATPISVRQTVTSGAQDSSGDPAFMVAGAGLAVNIAATATPLQLTYSAGSSATGDVNYIETIAADIAGAVSALPASNLTYIAKTYQGAWAAVQSPPQYGKAFDKTAQFLCRWPGANNAVATTEDFGNTLTFFGNAKLSTATQILGLNTLALDGTGDYITVPFTSLGQDSWEIFCAFRTSSLAVTQSLFNFKAAAGVYQGILVEISTAGKLTYYMSTDGAANDIAMPVGAATLVINTTYYFRLVHDAVAGTYKTYLSNNGAAETVDSTLTTAQKVCSGVELMLGAQLLGSNGLNGNLGFFGIRRFASYTSAQAAGPTVAPTFADVRQDWFNTSNMTMYQVTAASTVAGTNPTFTAVNKLYVGEVITGAATVTSVRNYAYKGTYTSTPLTISAGNLNTINHNIGQTRLNIRTGYLTNFATAGHYANQELLGEINYSRADATPVGVGFKSLNRNVIEARTSDTSSPSIKSGVTGAMTTVAYTSLKLLVEIKRGW